MTSAEIKRRVGYVAPEYKSRCGTCRRCVRRGTHLRCARFGFAVTADGICRDGYEHDEPLNAQEHPLLVGNGDVPEEVAK